MEDYLYDSIIAAISRDDVSTLLYIWTESFKRGREGIAVRQLIDGGVSQIVRHLGYKKTNSFSKLVRRWYWSGGAWPGIEYLLENDLHALVELLRDTPYRAPTDAFVEGFYSKGIKAPVMSKSPISDSCRYYPMFGKKFTHPVYAYDVGRLVYYLCLKSEKKEGLQEAVGLFITQVTEVLDDDPTYIENITDPDGIARQPYEFTLQGLYELCHKDEWYEPIYIICRTLLPKEGSTFDLEITVVELASRYKAPEAILAHILRDIIHSSVKAATIAKFLVLLLKEECCEDLIKNLIREEAPVELLYVLAGTASREEVDLEFEEYPEEKKYAIIRMYFQRTAVDKMSKTYFRHFLSGKRGFAWFEPSFRFDRKKYVSYFGEDEALHKVES